jgi:hypothetical protein
MVGDIFSFANQYLSVQPHTLSRNRVFHFPMEWIYSRRVPLFDRFACHSCPHHYVAGFGFSSRIEFSTGVTVGRAIQGSIILMHIVASNVRSRDLQIQVTPLHYRHRGLGDFKGPAVDGTNQVCWLTMELQDSVHSFVNAIRTRCPSRRECRSGEYRGIWPVRWSKNDLLKRPFKRARNYAQPDLH